MTVGTERSLLARLAELHEKATPAPWSGETDDVWAEGRCLLANYFDYARDADSTLIVEVRNALPKVLRLVEAAETVERRWGKAAGCYGDDWTELRAALALFLSEEVL